MDLLDVAILALRLALVGVLYAFLFLVMRSAARGLQTAPAAAVVAIRPSRLQLQVLETGVSTLRAGQIIEVAGGATLGRAEHVQVVIADSTVSAEHARILPLGRAWMVTDLGSTNGTRVNDVPVQAETQLASGDVLALGNVRLKVIEQ